MLVQYCKSNLLQKYLGQENESKIPRRNITLYSNHILSTEH